MAENSKIEWTDHTFNPWTGCTKVSPACDHCYAEEGSKRAGAKVGKWGPGMPRVRTTPANWAKPIKWDAQAKAEGRRFRVFCASLADVFDNEVDPAWRRNLFKLIAETPNLDWLLLTKRVGNALRMVKEIADLPRPGSHAGDLLAHQWRSGNPPKNVWLGITVCDQKEADRDIPKLLAVPAAKRFLSMEPALGAVDLTKIQWPEKHKVDVLRGGAWDLPGWVHKGFVNHSDMNTIDWVIVGGESGHGARPMHPDWARSLRDQCAEAGVPFLFKQWGEWVPRGPEAWGYPLVEGVPRIRLTDTGENGSDLGAGGDNHVWMQRAGKKAAGRMLDGRTWEGVPS
ncbi:phage Gp37/Gp68 family protein [Pseudacidovorax intermedius]|uniref:phage Gp37/Gp68 family protein n=1 Tax=Pseudacidovorax intermedius TaxID=433924 RepID=UPI000346378B|nr:phage Gp37/Gp68 family protein [Pseudacidovorax intermedius]